jgi:hypothetical protein
MATLDKWLNIKVKKYDIKRYFYCDWTNKFKPPCAQWLTKKPKDINFVELVRWPDVDKNHAFFMCGKFKDDMGTNYKSSRESKYRNVPFLKSHLQKSVRKMNKNLALKTTYHFLKLDPMSLLRRLPIIMMEDSIVINELTTLIWLMVLVSSTKMKMKKYMYEYILGLVWYMCHDKEHELISWKSNEKYILKDILDEYKELEIDQLSILYCLHLRKSYGGMKVDRVLIDEIIDNYRVNFINKIPIKVAKIRPISFDLDNLNLDEWDLSAIDFHCSKQIIMKIKERYPKLKESEIKELIWHNSSKINKRKKSEIFNEADWKMIKEDLRFIQEHTLNCYH